MSTDLGTRIREQRERLHLTQSDLAREVGVTLRTIGNWERGENIPRNRLAALQDVLGIDLQTGALLEVGSTVSVSGGGQGDVMLDLPPAIFEGLTPNQIDELKAGIRAEAWKRRREIMGE